jgi:predicted metalloprotease with PDZ domain
MRLAFGALGSIALAACSHGARVNEADEPAPALAVFRLSVTHESLAHRRAHIEINVPAEVTSFEAPLTYAGAPMFLRYVTDLHAIDESGSVLALETHGHVVRVATAGAQRYTLHYVYNVPQSRSGEVDQSLPTLGATHGRFDNNLTFLEPKAIAQAPAELVVSAPVELEVLTSWGEERRARVAHVKELISGMIVLGDYRVSAQMLGPTRVVLAMRGDYDERLLRTQLLRVFASQIDIAGPLPASQVLVVVQDTVDECCRGTALTNALVVNMPSATPLEPFNFRAVGTISHELFHLWNFAHVQPASDEGAYLLTEGFTNYFAIAALVHAQLLPPEGFARFLWRYRTLLEANREYPGADYAAIQRGFATNHEQLRDLAYTKGPFVAALLDLALRDDTDGRESVVSWFRALAERHGGKTGYTLEDLRALTIELSGTPSSRAVAVFDHAFMGSGPLDLDGLVSRLGIACDPEGICRLAPLAANPSQQREKLFSARP